LCALSSCKDVHKGNEGIGTASSVDSSGLFFKKDSLTAAELGFLKTLRKENDNIIWINGVDRYLDSSGNIVLSRLVIPRQLLSDSGFVYFSLDAIGFLTDVKITYSYSRGQADYGNGSVIGDTPDHYIHTFKGCGVTACSETLYKDGVKDLDVMYK